MSWPDLADAALTEATHFRRLLADKRVEVKVAWDVGGNAGLYAMAMAEVFPGARVHTFEPVQANLAILRENVAANALAERIVIHPVGISDTCQRASLGIPKHREPENTGLFSVRYGTPELGKDIVYDCELVDGAAALELSLIHI